MNAPIPDLKRHFAGSLRPEHVMAQTPVIKQADAILILGNRSRGASMLLARHAADLYRQGYAKKIIVSGGVINHDGRLEADHIRYCLRSRGIAADAITVERKSTNTKENIIFSRDIAKRMRDLPKHPKIIVVGQKFASLRILMTMAAQWPEAIPMISSICMMGMPTSRWKDHPYAMNTVAKEYVNIPVYREKGDIKPVDQHSLKRRLAMHKARVLRPRPRQI